MSAEDLKTEKIQAIIVGGFRIDLSWRHGDITQEDYAAHRQQVLIDLAEVEGVSVEELVGRTGQTKPKDPGVAPYLAAHGHRSQKP